MRKTVPFEITLWKHHIVFIDINLELYIFVLNKELAVKLSRYSNS